MGTSVATTVRYWPYSRLLPPASCTVAYELSALQIKTVTTAHFHAEAPSLRGYTIQAFGNGQTY